MRKNRIHFTKDSEEEMKKAVKMLCGNPANISFWDKAKDYCKRLAQHTANSLRSHWRLMISREEVEKKSVNLVTCEIETDIDSESIVLTDTRKDIINNSRQEMPVLEDIENPAKKVRKSENGQLSEQEVLDKFEDLMDLCRYYSRRDLKKEEVLKALIENKGKVEETISIFLCN